MFIKENEAYQRFLSESGETTSFTDTTTEELLKKASLDAAFLEEMLKSLMMSYVKDFVYWMDSSHLHERMPEKKPLGFDLDSLDELEECCFHIFELQKTEGLDDEEELHFAAKMISAFLSAMMHYQFGFQFAYPRSLKEDGSHAVGIRFPSGREFSIYAFVKLLLSQLLVLKEAGDNPGKYNGLTKDFFMAMLRVEQGGELDELPLYQEWYQGLETDQKRKAETFCENQRRKMGVSLLKQEENADSTPMIFAYYCLDLLLDLFDGSLADLGRQLDIEMPLNKFRFSKWYGLDALITIKTRKLKSEGLLINTLPSQWKWGEALRRRLAGLMVAVFNISAPFDCTFLYPTNRFNVWVVPFAFPEAKYLNKSNEAMLTDEEAFSAAINQTILKVFNTDASRLLPGLDIKKAFDEAVARLIIIEQRHMPGKALERLSLAGAVVNQYEVETTQVEKPEKIFASRRSLCYAVTGELRGQNKTGASLFQNAVKACLQWVNARLVYPHSHVVYPGDAFDPEKHIAEGMPSFAFEGAFTAQVFSFPEQNKWLLRLHEPDNGVYQSYDDFIPGEPGRFVENHIAFWLEGSKLMSSFFTFVTRTFRSKSHYRGSCASLLELLRDQGLALRNGGVFDPRPLICMTQGDARSLGAQLQQSLADIPAVICVYQDAIHTVREIHQKLDDTASMMHKAGQGVGMPAGWNSWKEELLEQESAAWEMHKAQVRAILTLVNRGAYKMRLVLLPAELADRFSKASRLTVPESGLSLYYGKGNAPQLSLTEDHFLSAPEKVAEQLLDAIVDANEARELQAAGFDYNQALEMQNAAEAEKISVNEVWQAYHDSEVKLVREKHSRELERMMREHERVQAKHYSDLKALQRELEALKALQDEEAQKLAGNVQDNLRIEELVKELNTQSIRQDYLESLQGRPQRFDGVEGWIASRFSSTLELTSRAVRELKMVQPNAFNLPLLCDCLEFLAIEYHQDLQGQINKEELIKRCEIKYGRLFSVTPNKSGVRGEYGEQYQVFWQGKKRELDLHLKVGNTAPHLIRIYFYYDAAERKICIGSLPGHLDAGS